MTERARPPHRVPRARAPTWIWVGAIALPTLPFYFGLASSLALGTTLFIAGMLVFDTAGVRRTSRSTPLVFLGAVLVAVMSHLAVASLLVPVDVVRASASALLLMAGLRTAQLLADQWGRWAQAPLDRSVDAVLVFAVVALVIRLVGLAPDGAKSFDKPVFPFTEPSHFALALLPFLMYRCITLRGWHRVVLVCAAWATAFALENLTLLAGSLLVTVVCLRTKSLIVLTAGALAVAASGIDFDYYLNRLDFTSDNTNLSALVYIQGWQMVEESLLRSGGWGLGFQQLGVFGTEVPATELIMNIVDEQLNVLDGGFTMAKLVSEFGVFGIALMLMYASHAWRAVRELMADNPAQGPAALAQSFVVSYVVELLVRGAGYFTMSSVLVVAAVLYLRQERRATHIRALTKALRVKSSSA